MSYDGDVKWIPVSSAAKLMGVSTARVRQLIRASFLTSVKMDSTVLVSSRSVEGWLAQKEMRFEDAA